MPRLKDTMELMRVDLVACSMLRKDSIDELKKSSCSKAIPHE